MAYSIEQRVFLMTFHRLRYQDLGKSRKAPSRCAINRLLNKSEKTGSKIDSRKGVVGKKKFVRTPMSAADGCGRRWCIYWKCVFMNDSLPRLANSKITTYSDICC
jgi:hypothetical protein